MSWSVDFSTDQLFFVDHFFLVGNTARRMGRNGFSGGLYSTPLVYYGDAHPRTSIKMGMLIKLHRVDRAAPVAAYFSSAPKAPAITVI